MKRNTLLAALMIFAALPALGATLLPGQSVITHFSDNQPPGPGIPVVNPLAPVVAVYDTRNSSASPLFPNRWQLAGTNAAGWNYQTMGEVFGIATDDASSPNIYVTSTAVYTGNQVTQLAPGTGRVFRINGSNGSVITIATLANTGQGLATSLTTRRTNSSSSRTSTTARFIG